MGTGCGLNSLCVFGWNELGIMLVCLVRRNSEIYNHEQLRRDLLGDIESTGSDSVVVGHLYAKFGPSKEVLNAMDGIFCGVVYDESSNDFFAFRDPMGVTPLYWGKGTDGSIWFSSEMKALQETCDKLLECAPPVSLAQEQSIAVQGKLHVQKFLRFGLIDSLLDSRNKPYD